MRTAVKTGLTWDELEGAQKASKVPLHFSALLAMCCVSKALSFVLRVRAQTQLPCRLMSMAIFQSNIIYAMRWQLGSATNPVLYLVTLRLHCRSQVTLGEDQASRICSGLPHLLGEGKGL